MAEPSVSSSGSPFSDDSYETSQTSRSAKLQQSIIPSEYPFGEPVEFTWPLSNAWFGFGVGEHFPPLTSGSPFLAVIIPPSPRTLLQNLMVDSDMDSSGPNGSEGIPVFDEQYQLFPEDIQTEPAQSSPSVSLPVGYRSLGQIMAIIASMETSNPSRGLVLPSLGMSPTTPIFSSTPLVTYSH